MGLFDKLKRGLEKTEQILRTDVRDLFRAGQILDDKLLEDFESRMIRTDMGVKAASRIVERIRTDHGGRTIDVDAVWKTIHDEMVELLKGHDAVRWDLSNPLSPLAKVASGPTVILVAGVNGVGKTTSIAKLANLLQKNGNKRNKKGSATVLNNVNNRFEKRFSNSIFCSVSTGVLDFLRHGFQCSMRC